MNSASGIKPINHKKIDVATTAPIGANLETSISTQAFGAVATHAPETAQGK